jgi:protein-tyrosine-phosphatase
MALGWFTHLAKDQAIAWSGGAEPVAVVSPEAVAAMAEAGIDISEEFASRGPMSSSSPPTWS